ncbi:MAG: pyridoxamine 5'-phosphate oxidase family protein [Actinomycetota bacterium]|nr:pyridoxamine 5'-phosphate oxidase family protein [Actinomycetota bacterium]
MSRREQIRMTDAQVDAFLDEQRVVIVATHGPDGWPHLMPLWYVVRDGLLWGWTYAKSQKARNLERDPRATLQVEDGERYEELRGVMLRTETRLHRDVETVAGIGLALVDRYHGAGPNVEAMRDAFRAQASKRVGLEFVEVGRRATWDHRKLAGSY